MATTVLVTPVFGVAGFSAPALANCTVTAGGGSVANPNNGGTITCTVAGGTHNGTIGSDETNLSVILEPNAIIDNANIGYSEIINITSGTVTMQAGSTATNVNDTENFHSGIEVGSTNAGSLNLTLEDDAELHASSRPISVGGGSGSGTLNANITMSGNNSVIASHTNGGGAVNPLYVRTNNTGGGNVDLLMSGNNATMFAKNDNVVSVTAAGTTDVDITLSGTGANLYGEGGPGINLYGLYSGGGTVCGLDLNLQMSGDNTQILANSWNGAVINDCARTTSGGAVSTITLSGENASIHFEGIDNRAGRAAVRTYGGTDVTAQATITLESNTSITTLASYGISVYGGEYDHTGMTTDYYAAKYGTQVPATPNPASNPPSSIDNAGLISSARNSIKLHNGNDLVTLRTGSNLVSAEGADAGDGTDTLTLIGTGSEDEIFLNFENLDMDGTDWSIESDSAFTDITINSGVLRMNGTIASANDLDVTETGTLGGSGTITGNVVNDGTVAPGNSIGTLTIDGDYTQNADDELIIEFDHSSNDILSITGSGTLAGTVTFVEINHGLSNGATFTFLSAGSLAGSFSTVNLTPAPGSNLVSATVNQVGNDLQVTLNGGGPPDACVLYSGSGTPASPVDGDVFKCTEPTSPHTSTIGTSAEGTGASVLLRPNATVSTASDAIDLDEAIVTLESGATLESTTGAAIRSYSATNGVYTNLTVAQGATVSGSNWAVYASGVSNPPSIIDNAGSIIGGNYAVRLGDGDDVLTLRTGSNLQGAAQMGGGSDTMFLTGTGTEDTYFINLETVTMNGDDWTLSGGGTFNNLTVNTGTLSIDGIFTTPADIAEDGTLGGTGNITGNVTNISGGIFSPGTGGDDLDVTGNFTQNAASVFELRFDGGGSGYLDLSGAATLDGTLRITETAPGATNNTTYTFLDAGSISGSFPVVDFQPAGGSLLDYKKPTVNQIGNALQVTFLESPCRVTTGTGTFHNPSDNDVVTCTTTNGPHTYAIGNIDLDESLTVNLAANARIEFTSASTLVTDPEYQFVHKYGSINSTDTTVTLGAGASIAGYYGSAVINSTDTILEYTYNGGEVFGTSDVYQNVTLGPNSEISLTLSGGGEAYSDAAVIRNLAAQNNANSIVELSGNNSSIRVDSDHGQNAGINLQGRYCDTDCADELQSATVTLSGDDTSLEVYSNTGYTTNIGIRVGNVFLGSPPQYAPSTYANVTLSGQNAAIESQGTVSAGGITNINMSYQGESSTDTVVTLSGEGARISSIKPYYDFGGESVGGEFAGIGAVSNLGISFYGSPTGSTTVTLSGNNTSIYSYSYAQVGAGVTSMVAGKYSGTGTSDTTITLSGDNAEIEGVGSGLGAIGAGVLSQGAPPDASATITLESSTAIRGSHIGLYMSGGAPGQGYITIDSAGTIEGGYYSFVLGTGDDQVTLRTGSQLNSVVGANAHDGTDTLTLVGTATEDEIFTNFEILVMNGTDWTLSEDSIFSDIQVNTGSLSLNGTISGPIYVSEGAILKGTGTLSGPITNDGEVAPGNSIGTMTIDGDFVQNADDLLTIEFSSSSSDLLLFTSGSATLAGEVHFVELGTGTPSGTTYTFIDGLSIINEFDEISFTPAGGSDLSRAYVDYVGNDVQVTFIDCAECSMAGRMEYDAAEEVFKFCDGTYWNSISSLTVGAGCSDIGTIDYNSTTNNFDFCNGTNLVPFFINETLAACSDPGTIEFNSSTFQICNGTNWIDIQNRCLE